MEIEAKMSLFVVFSDSRSLYSPSAISPPGNSLNHILFTESVRGDDLMGRLVRVCEALI